MHVFNFQSSYNSDNSGRNIFLILTLKSWIIIFKITFISNQSRVKQCLIAGTSGSCLNCINPVKLIFSDWLFPALYFVTSQPGKIFDAKIQRSEQNNVIGAISDFWRSLCSFDFHNVPFWFSLRALVIQPRSQGLLRFQDLESGVDPGNEVVSDPTQSLFWMPCHA